MMSRQPCLALCLLVLVLLVLLPLPAPPVSARAAAPGSIELSVTATDTNHQIYTVREIIPVAGPGPLTLLYPQWEPGSHAPTASVAELAGLVLHAADTRIEWHRDPVQTHAFHLEVPAGARALTAEFRFLAPRSSTLLRPDMIVVPWHRVLLYPAGRSLEELPVDARLTLPAGLQAFTALDLAGKDGDTLIFAPTTLEELVDAPVYAARHCLQRPLSPGGRTPVRLDVLADHPEQLVLPPQEEQKLRDMLTQASRVFGVPPYRHYDMILTLSDLLSPGGGNEHLEEGESNLAATYLADLPHQLMNRDLIVHEYVHVWNGRFRQPADLHVPTLNEPMGDSLLWVYEGQTEFWGQVLAARAGLRSLPETLDRLAMDAALVANRPGRAWKSLADSSYDPLSMAGHPVAWRDFQRREDYYPEGVLLWLDVDARLRELSGGQRSLDDFAHAFFATRGAAGAPVSTRVSTYTFQDICNTLNAVAADDWAARLRRHLESHSDADALAGLARSGWRLRYDAIPSETFRQDEKEAGVRNLDDSAGMQVRSDGTVRSVVWDGPAFTAGLAPGSRITQVDGQPFTIAALEQAVRDAGTAALSLTFTVNGAPQSVHLDYHGSLRYPRLERIEGTADRLTPLLAARP